MQRLKSTGSRFRVYSTELAKNFGIFNPETRRSEFFPSRIPDPVVKKAPEPDPKLTCYLEAIIPSARYVGEKQIHRGENVEVRYVSFWLPDGTVQQRFPQFSRANSVLSCFEFVVFKVADIPAGLPPYE